jgi:hypothetical protein
MHVPWRLHELDVIRQGLMMFTPAEAEKMQMNTRARMAAAAFLQLSRSPGSRHRIDSPAECGLELTVKIYNSAHISVRDLIKAEALATEIFDQLRIKLSWEPGLMARDVKDAFESTGHLRSC